MKSSTRASHFFRDRRAATAVEFAMIVPVFLAIIFGIVAYGSYLAMVNGVQQLAAEAARFSIGGLSDSERTTLAKNYVTANANTYPLLNASRISVNAAASPTDANTFVVAVNYDASQTFIYSLPSFVPLPPSTVVRSAAIPRGGY